MLLSCILLLALGAISFTSIGLLIGLLTKTQSAARAISTIVYFPLIYPAMAADIAPSTQHLAKVLPSFYLYRGLREILNYQSPITTIKPDIIGLVIFAIIFFGATLLGYRAVLHRDS